MRDESFIEFDATPNGMRALGALVAQLNREGVPYKLENRGEMDYDKRGECNRVNCYGVVRVTISTGY